MCQTYFKKMTGLFLFLFFATVLGCSSPTERMVNRIRDFAGYEQELLDVFEKIQDKAALDAADSELRAVLAKLSEFNQDITSLNEEFYGPDPSIDAQQALSFRLNEVYKELELPQLAEKVKKEKERINAIPGATEYLKTLAEEVAKETGGNPNYLKAMVLVAEKKPEPKEKSKKVEFGPPVGE